MQPIFPKSAAPIQRAKNIISHAHVIIHSSSSKYMLSISNHNPRALSPPSTFSNLKYYNTSLNPPPRTVKPSKQPSPPIDPDHANITSTYSPTLSAHNKQTNQQTPSLKNTLHRIETLPIIRICLRYKLWK